jgi:cell division protein FtsB
MTKRLRRRALWVGLAGLAIWVAFFDSHSLLRRVGYARELDRLTVENEQIVAENEALNAQIERGLDDETLERVAREEYGMRRPGERVYRVETPEADD